MIPPFSHPPKTLLLNKLTDDQYLQGNILVTYLLARATISIPISLQLFEKLQCFLKVTYFLPSYVETKKASPTFKISVIASVLSSSAIVPAECMAISDQPPFRLPDPLNKISLYAGNVFKQEDLPSIETTDQSLGLKAKVSPIELTPIICFSLNDLNLRNRAIYTTSFSDTLKSPNLITLS